MNGGAFGENFPYTNFHDLNMDWIIKEIKDFLDEKSSTLSDIDTAKTTALEEIQNTESASVEEMEAEAERIAQEVIATIPSDYSELSRNAIKAETLISGPYTSGTGIATIDSPVANSLYRLQLTTKPDWFPSTYPLTGTIMYMIDISYVFSGTTTIYRYIFDSMFNIRYRMWKQPFGSWSAWEEYENASYTAIKVGNLIAGDPTGTAVESKESLVANTLYRTQLTSQPSWIPDTIDMSGIKYILKVEYPWSQSPAQSIMIFDERFNKLGFVTKQPASSTWSAWYFYQDGKATIIVPIEQDTITLEYALQLAYYWGDSIVQLEEGDYVINSFSGLGMPIGNNVTLKGTAKTRIIANSSEGLQYFSILMAQAGDFTIENIEFRGSNIRYCIHDDPAGDNANVPAYHIYKNCKFYINNDNNSVWPNNQCLGGGLGICTTVVIENCVFESSTPDNNGLASYHNNASTGAKGKIIVKDSVFMGDNGTFRASWYGASTDITPVFAMNNTLGRDIIFSAETAESTNVNMSLTEWNNEIRTEDPLMKVLTQTLTFNANVDYAIASGVSGYEMVNAYNSDWSGAQVMIIGMAQQGATSDNRIVFRKDSTAQATMTIKKILIKK